MAKDITPIDVTLEIGHTRTFASALDWPGWSRSGRDEASALRAIFDYAPRYARAIQDARLNFRLPDSPSDLLVVERLPGNATTDYGAPGIPPSQDSEPVDPGALQRMQILLQACWQTFDAAAGSAAGRELRKGPRGGGRYLESIVRHVNDAELAYLSALGGKWKPSDGNNPAQAQLRQAILAALASSVRSEIPARGPRGGLRWTPRYFVRRTVWHALDHAWEIEDRVA